MTNDRTAEMYALGQAHGKLWVELQECRAALDTALAEMGELQESCGKLKSALSDARRERDEAREALNSALELSAAVTDYRHTHDIKGDGHIATGRAWDRMRNANTKFRSALSSARSDGDDNGK